MTEITFDGLREMLLYRKIVKWNENVITLDNGIELSIEETDSDCCARAIGEFTNVVLDAAITEVRDIHYEAWEDEGGYGEYGCNASVTIMHNQNIICSAIGSADAGNGGYYYSIASFIVKIPKDVTKVCHFVSSEDGRE